eukprot:TRINITY_DN30878_c0_g1_i1.p1 TRINITY_DN30878_c0_g1~~TRINITY_DN30878_c0_g1_i1.p1  ORF type:complete len:521 (+),score=155.38 TRINITY_DN30878_c0_g1_i1:213-1775(+)
MVNEIDFEEESYDDVTIGLQMQQFFDEWNYRVLHSGLAYTMDREESIIKALDLFCMHGLQLSSEEKEYLANLDTEAEMIAKIVKHMDLAQRKTFEHFALQLQLVLSTATRVRHALEESTPEEVARIMEDGDGGVGQQVLKQTVTAACMDVHSMGSKKDSWAKSMDSRIGRLVQCAYDAESAKQQLEALGPLIDTFNTEHLVKAKKFFIHMLNGDKRQLQLLAFRNWFSHTATIKAEAHIRNKFQKQIDEAEATLLELKAAKIENVSKVLQQQADAGWDMHFLDVLRSWSRVAKREKEERELADETKRLEDKMKNLSQTQKDAGRKVLARLVSISVESFASLCFHAFASNAAEARESKLYERAVKETESKLAEYMERKSKEAKNVLERLLCSTETGTIAHCFSLWAEIAEVSKTEAAHEVAMKEAKEKYKHLNTRQKKAAANVAMRAGMLEEQNLLMWAFDAWSGDAKLDRVIRHFNQKLDSKKHQLEAVQTMFHSFASQLEQGINKSPRSHKKAGEKSRK